MVIVYDLETKRIRYTEDSKMEPAMPPGTLSEKVERLKAEGLGFVSVPYELGADVTDYILIFGEAGNFVGLQPDPEVKSQG